MCEPQPKCGAEDSAGERFSPSTMGAGFQEGHQAWQQAPFPTDPSHWPKPPRLCAQS